MSDLRAIPFLSFIVYLIQDLSDTQGRGLLNGYVLRAYREEARIEYCEDM